MTAGRRIRRPAYLVFIILTNPATKDQSDMNLFTTPDGRNWTLSLNVGVIERVKAGAGINLANPLAPDARLPTDARQPDLLNLLWYDLARFGDVLRHMLKRQLATNTISAEDFIEQLDAATVAAAFEAFRETWADFFRNRKEPEMENFIRKTWEAIRIQRETMVAETESQIAKLREKNQQTGSESPMSGQAHSESTPAG
jgi:hypothetical protein